MNKENKKILLLFSFVFMVILIFITIFLFRNTNNNNSTLYDIIKYINSSLLIFTVIVNILVIASLTNVDKDEDEDE